MAKKKGKDSEKRRSKSEQKKEKEARIAACKVPP